MSINDNVTESERFFTFFTVIDPGIDASFVIFRQKYMF